ncbi:MAG: 2-hydroxy-3-keto-5-methylthiopentenyl-1-phosphate phosphatase [Candidatus Omnitrophota bacterium]|jgi:2-hydroxy-3-keto-5-methylthiopentenyl-1-phosphate phosphatase
MMNKPQNTAKWICVIDFDGTISRIDVIDGLLQRYGDESLWQPLEGAWLNGEISSDDCMSRQLNTISVKPAELEQYINSIELDSGFDDLVRYLDEAKMPLLILSDGFDYFIERILKKHDLGHVQYKSNHLSFDGKQFTPEFPYKHAICKKCANCKRRAIQILRPEYEKIIFVGDGLSDCCAIDEADIVYAKARLAQFCLEKKRVFTPYSNLDDVLNDIKKLVKTPI